MIGQAAAVTIHGVDGEPAHFIVVGCRCVHDSYTVGMEQADLHPAQPDGVVDSRDIGLVVVAYEGKPYPYAEPCP